MCVLLALGFVHPCSVWNQTCPCKHIMFSIFKPWTAWAPVVILCAQKFWNRFWILKSVKEEYIIIGHFWKACVLWTSFHSECSVGRSNGVWFQTVPCSQAVQIKYFCPLSGYLVRRNLCWAELGAQTLRKQLISFLKSLIFSRYCPLEMPQICSAVVSLQISDSSSSSGSSSPAFQINFHSVGHKMKRGAVNNRKGVSDADVFCLEALWVLTESSWNCVHGAEGSNAHRA